MRFHVPILALAALAGHSGAHISDTFFQNAFPFLSTRNLTCLHSKPSYHPLLVIAVVTPQNEISTLTHVSLVREQNRLTIDQMPPACNLAACLGLSGTASCIVSAISSGDPAALQRCLVNGLAQICSCAACVPLVDNFLISLGVCVSKPGGNETAVPEAAMAYFESFMTKGKTREEGVDDLT
ncbi:hypothetical protein N7533_004935, partial [Penicillium manginii]|uniref:uncharacterized protein n=1 Tax=Penicillium manginii TaxID=203109 RepID=UPI002547DF2F